MKSRRNIIKPFATILFAAIMVFSAVAAMCTTASAATDDEIELAINKGIDFLVEQQNDDGSWGEGETPAYTGFALIKLEDRSREKGSDPLDPDGPYYDEISAGLEYLMSIKKSVVPSGEIYFENNWGSHQTYNTGIALMAIANSGSYEDDVQDIVDWFILTQNADGGWIYSPSTWDSDNSNTGYAALGLAYAEEYGADIEDVLPGLNSWANYIQNDQGSDDDGWEDDPDGGSGYTNPTSWVNILKTGNLIFEFGLVGDNADSQRVQYAVDYIVRHWDDNNQDPGWRPHHYQAMYCTMKGLESLQISEIDGIDWFDEFSTVIVDTQLDDGSWPKDYWGDPEPSILSTVWALLTLEKATVIQVIPVDVDIKPGSCPNPLELKKKGVLPAAILGTEDFDVTTIDPESIFITIEGTDANVAPLRWSYEDVGTPYMGEEECGCHELGGDGYLDLTLKFDTQGVIAALALENDMGTIPLIIKGNLIDENDVGTPIQGQDCIKILAK